MHGFFVAEGPDFKRITERARFGTLTSIAALQNIQYYPRSNIDGKAERIDFILNK